MKRIMLVLLMILCLAIILCTASADGISSKQSKEMVLAEAEAAYPDWTISAAASYGTGRYHDTLAMYVDVLLFRVEGNTLRMKWLTVWPIPSGRERTLSGERRRAFQYPCQTAPRHVSQPWSLNA